MNKKQFKTRKELSAFLKEKSIDTTNWSEEKWLSLSKSQAEIHIQALAEAMWDAMNESTPKQLQAGEWHIPFHEAMSEQRIKDLHLLSLVPSYKTLDEKRERIYEIYLKIATGRCARLSYMTFEGEINYEKDIALHDRLLQDKHMSPFEHCAKAMTDSEYELYIKGVGKYTTMHKGLIFDPNSNAWCDNFKGFISYRHFINRNK